jgi:hypothetical protein
LGVGVIACGGGPGNNAASKLVNHPEVPTDKQAKCKVAKSQSEPLIVEWPDSARGKLESMVQRGLVAVHYEGCELQVLSQCKVKKAEYRYQPITRKQSRVTIKDEDDLYANMPVGAVKLEGKLKTAGQLNVQMTIVGRYEAANSTIYREDLEGDCGNATHVVAALTVGSFTFFAGSDAEIGGGAGVGVAGMTAAAGGVKSLASKETLQKDGDEASCAKSSLDQKAPPEGCGALLQIEVFPFAKGAKTAAVDPVPVPAPIPTPSTSGSAGPKPPIKCKPGEKLINGECTDPRKKPPSDTPPTIAKTCPYGQHMEGSSCVPDAIQCPPSTHREGTLCVDDAPPVTNNDGFRNKPLPPPDNPGPIETPNPWRAIAAYGFYGFGTIGVLSGVYAIVKVNSAKESCGGASTTGGNCSSDKSTALALGVAADVSFALAAASGILYFVLPANTKVGVSPLPGGAYVGAGKSF